MSDSPTSYVPLGTRPNRSRTLTEFCVVNLPSLVMLQSCVTVSGECSSRARHGLCKRVYQLTE